MGTPGSPPDPKEFDRLRQIENYISKRWDQLNAFANKGEERIANWVFILNTGGLASGLAFIATKGPTLTLFLSTVSCGAGVVFITLWGAIAYFRYEHLSSAFKKDVKEFEAGRISFEKLTADDRERSGRSQLMMLLALLASLAFCSGMTFGFIAMKSAVDELQTTSALEQQAPVKVR